VRDACGNTFEADDRATRFQQNVFIHPRPVVVFDGCSADKPIDLLQGGPAREIGLRVQGDAVDEGPFTAEVRFEGDGDSWLRNVTFDHRKTVKVEKPGVYTIQNVDGKHCSGESGANWMCTAREVSPPTASIQFDPIQDPCAGPVGVKALAVLSGKAPFRVKYRVLRQGRPAQEHEQTIHRTREEIEFRPSAEGEVTYTFTGLADANYHNIALDGPSFTQILHPVAKASFDLSKRRQGQPDVVLHSCQGDVAKAQLNFEGVGPYEVTYAIRGDSGQILETEKVKGIKSSTAPFEFKIPKQIAAKGGQLTVSLISVKDAKGCERPLTVPDLSIEVQRSKPSVSFVEPRESAMLEGKNVNLPLRLAGQGPWTVRYRMQNQDGNDSVVERTLQNAESLLDVNMPGAYEIIDVRDKYCPGTVVTDRAVHTVTIRPRPDAKFSEKGMSVSASSGALIRSSICLGEQDSTVLSVQGHFPISVSYTHRSPGQGDATVSSFNAAQRQTSLQLSTNVEGKHRYRLTQVGDAVYPVSPMAQKKGAYIELEQTVLPLPYAEFEQQNSQVKQQHVSLCLGEALSNKDKSRAVPAVILTGQTPLTLEYAIKDGLGVTRKSLTKSGITEHKHALEVDRSDFPFDGTGKWSIDLIRVVDGNGCERSLIGSETGGQTQRRKPRMDIEVVESANISPVGTRADYCVGESIDFVLQGSSPWTVEYDFEGRKSQATVKTTTFSRVAEHPGTLHVNAIAHQHNRCQTSVSGKAGMTKTIHALPTVHIREGSHFIEDLREGNQAEIVFRLDGEPPFSFTYQRTQAVDRFSRPQILETHTVTDVQDKSYTITTAEEGTWSVIWLQDRWCAVSMDAVAGKAVSQGAAKKMIAQSAVGGSSSLKVSQKAR
jgi:nucleoporin POM152